jgi:hypothetical protein
MGTSATVNRVVFSTPRAAEFLELRALQAQTGQPVSAFGDVVVKELLDNALDAAESAGRPPVIDVDTYRAGETIVITVADNGNGISSDTVARLCDFNMLVSDKARYRGPARGAQGNALKTLLGIPYALGVTDPVVIESAGIRHQLQVSIDALGDVVIAHDQTESGRREGTSVTIAVPDHVEVNADRWVCGAAFVNPHATFSVTDRANRGPDATTEFYKPGASGWSKWTPSAPSSPHWYDAAAFSALVHSHIRETGRTGVDVPLGKFIAEFEGLSGSAKQRKIRTAAAGITHLSALENREDVIAALHTAMLAEAKPTPPARLGPVGRDHLAAMLDEQWGVHRYWYKFATVTEAGVPWVIEVMVADTMNPGGVWFATNHAPAFGDPLGRVELRASDIRTTGAQAFLARAGINADCRAAVVHVICAATQFVDKGKVALVVPRTVAEAAAGALDAATKVVRREDQQRRKDADKADRAERQARDNARRCERAQQPTLKDAVFTVLPEAKRRAGAVVSARTLFYKVRPLVQDYTDKELDFGYFSQTLLPEFQREVGPLEGLYYEPRGELHHPHDGKVIRLGTREVESYVLPRWQFNKILYVEKTGLQAQLAPYRLAERYDMAIVFGEGYAVTACRTLLARSDIREMPIFVLHDADPYGYNIARTLAESTTRMPDHNIDVIDLGLTVPQAIEHQLETETFTRLKQLPAELDLDPHAQDWFGGQPVSAGYGRPQWIGRRCELNAFSSDGLAAFIEDGLHHHGAATKLIPPADVLAEYLRITCHERLVSLVTRELHARVDVETIARRHIDALDLTAVDANRIREVFTSQPATSWNTAAHRLIVNALDDAVTTELGDAIAADITAQLDRKTT